MWIWVPIPAQERKGGANKQTNSTKSNKRTSVVIVKTPTKTKILPETPTLALQTITEKDESTLQASARKLMTITSGGKLLSSARLSLTKKN